MRNYFKYAIYLIVSYGVSAAHAGSYEDFFRAVEQDDAQVVTTLVSRGFDPNTPDPQGLTGLFLALRLSSQKVAQVLASAPQIKVETRNAQDESPLMMAALKGNMAVARKLIERDADVNKPGWAPLHYAATGGHTAMIDLLLEHHAYIDAESPNGTTPLMMAAHYGTTAAVKLLLDSGADPTMKNQLGLTALNFAQFGGRADTTEMIAEAIRKSRPPGRW